jgi:hypothetical protein
MTPNFETMPIAELRDYAIAHREDLTALRTLFSRRDPHVSKHHFPDTEEGRVQMMTFLEQVAESENKPIDS